MAPGRLRDRSLELVSVLAKTPTKTAYRARVNVAAYLSTTSSVVRERSNRGSG
jgi:hypothetical protein